MNKKGLIMFHKKNKVTCNDVSIWTILWEYTCWVLSGKSDCPNNLIYKIGRTPKLKTKRVK